MHASHPEQLPESLPQDIQHLFASLTKEDIAYFFKGFEVWQLQQKQQNLQQRCREINEQIERNSEIMDRFQPSPLSLAALAQLQSYGVQDIDLLDQMLARGERWLDHTMNLLVRCEQLGMINGDYTEWCEHALEGAYDWLDSMPDSQPGKLTEAIYNEPYEDLTEELFFQKLMSEEDHNHFPTTPFFPPQDAAPSSSQKDFAPAFLPGELNAETEGLTQDVMASLDDIFPLENALPSPREVPSENIPSSPQAVPLEHVPPGENIPSSPQEVPLEHIPPSATESPGENIPSSPQAVPSVSSHEMEESISNLFASGTQEPETSFSDLQTSSLLSFADLGGEEEEPFATVDEDEPLPLRAQPPTNVEQEEPSVRDQIVESNIEEESSLDEPVAEPVAEEEEVTENESIESGIHTDVFEPEPGAEAVVEEEISLHEPETEAITQEEALEPIIESTAQEKPLASEQIVDSTASEEPLIPEQEAESPTIEKTQTIEQEEESSPVLEMEADLEDDSDQQEEMLSNEPEGTDEQLYKESSPVESLAEEELSLPAFEWLGESETIERELSGEGSAWADLLVSELDWSGKRAIVEEGAADQVIAAESPSPTPEQPGTSEIIVPEPTEEDQDNKDQPFDAAGSDHPSVRSEREDEENKKSSHPRQPHSGLFGRLFTSWWGH